MSSRSRVLSIAAEIVGERARQDEKWGAPHDVPNGTGPTVTFPGGDTFLELRNEIQAIVDGASRVGGSRMSWVLLEEVFEALAEDDDDKLREELIQVAAVAAKWVQIIDAREARA